MNRIGLVISAAESRRGMDRRETTNGLLEVEGRRRTQATYARESLRHQNRRGGRLRGRRLRQRLELGVFTDGLRNVQRPQAGLDMIVGAHLQGRGPLCVVDGGLRRGHPAAVDEDISSSRIQPRRGVGARHRWHAGDSHQ